MYNDEQVCMCVYVYWIFLHTLFGTVSPLFLSYVYSSVIQFAEKHQCVHAHTHQHRIVGRSVSGPHWVEVSLQAQLAGVTEGQQCAYRTGQDGSGMGAPLPHWKAPIVRPHLHQGPFIMGRGARLWVRKSPKHTLIHTLVDTHTARLPSSPLLQHKHTDGA